MHEKPISNRKEEMNKPHDENGERLSRVEHWDTRLGSVPKHNTRVGQWLRDQIPMSIREWSRRIRSDQAFRTLMCGILPNVLARDSSAQGKIMEIGSAPGHYGLAFLREFGLQPHGIEYSEKRAEFQRSLWVANGLPAEQVICGDFFDDALLSPLLGQFDVVSSFGFIEHFADPLPVVERHLALLKPGGVLVITVPNIGRGTFNGWRSRHLNPDLYGIHNVMTCTESRFRQLFQRPDLNVVYCGAMGGIAPEFIPDQRWRSRTLALLARGLAPGFRIFNNLLLGVRPVHWPRLSSMLTCVARFNDVAGDQARTQ